MNPLSCQIVKKNMSKSTTFKIREQLLSNALGCNKDRSSLCYVVKKIIEVFLFKIVSNFQVRSLIFC